MPGSDREQAAAPSCPSIGAGMIYRLLFACLVSLSSASSALAQATATPPHEPVAERPLRFEAAIAAFEARDRVDPPPKHAVLLSGASYMLRWTNAAAALAPRRASRPRAPRRRRAAAAVKALTRRRRELS
jgi:hypothetical protein